MSTTSFMCQIKIFNYLLFHLILSLNEILFYLNLNSLF